MKVNNTSEIYAIITGGTIDSDGEPEIQEDGTTRVTFDPKVPSAVLALLESQKVPFQANCLLRADSNHFTVENIAQIYKHARNSSQGNILITMGTDQLITISQLFEAQPRTIKSLSELILKGPEKSILHQMENKDLLAILSIFEEPLEDKTIILTGAMSAAVNGRKSDALENIQTAVKGFKAITESGVYVAMHQKIYHPKSCEKDYTKCVMVGKPVINLANVSLDYNPSASVSTKQTIQY